MSQVLQRKDIKRWLIIYSSCEISSQWREKVSASLFVPVFIYLLAPEMNPLPSITQKNKSSGGKLWKPSCWALGHFLRQHWTSEIPLVPVLKGLFKSNSSHFLCCVATPININQDDRKTTTKQKRKLKIHYQDENLPAGQTCTEDYFYHRLIPPL